MTGDTTVLVVGATGATGRLLVQQLLARGCAVRAIVRSPDSLPAAVRAHEHLSLIHASLLDLDDATLATHIGGCNAVASCLGHTVSWRGIFGPPWRLVTEAVRRLCAAIEATTPPAPVRVVLMNTSGNRNRDLDERVSLRHRVVIGLIRLLVPPHADNERAAEHLRTRIGQHHASIEWAAVRPDSLHDEDEVTGYEVHPSPTRDPIFDAGTTSRIHVARFMAELITDDDTWRRWRGRMPVVYDAPLA